MSMKKPSLHINEIDFAKYIKLVYNALECIIEIEKLTHIINIRLNQYYKRPELKIFTLSCHRHCIKSFMLIHFLGVTCIMKAC